ncbi:MAG: slipin family protein, partial [Nitrospinota bacterium]|nr:slipin family protein [Nitrospinota bacterium]
MFIIGAVFIRDHERGFLFRKGEFVKTLGRGRHWFFDPLRRCKVEVSSMRDPWIRSENLDLIVKANGLGDEAMVIDLADDQRALVWVEGRLKVVLSPGLYALWTSFKKVKVETVTVDGPLFDTPHVSAILKTENFDRALDLNTVEEGHVGVFFQDGKFRSVLGPGRRLFWKNAGRILVIPMDMRQRRADIAGQEIMTADKVTLRVNATMAFCVVDPVKAVSASDDAAQSLYREAQLALREAVGAADLDGFLASKEKLGAALAAGLSVKAQAFGMEVVSFGIRDVILPGEMKELMNKVTEARKAAEANLIARREETAAMRSQANSARILQENPALMRMRELETLEKIARSANLK